MSNNQISTTIPGRTASRNWKRIAKEIAASGKSLYWSARDLGLGEEWNPYPYSNWRDQGLVIDWPLEDQYMLALFIAEFVLTDGVME